MSSYQQLKEKLKHFIKRYYSNEIWKGIALLSLLLMLYLVLLYLLEINFYLAPTIKIIAVLALIVGGVYITSRYIVWPLMQLFGWSGRMTDEQAAKLIGTHFTDVQDRLLNILQLSHTDAFASSELALASIDQKAAHITPLPFTKAIDYRKTKKILPYLSALLLLVALSIVFFPQHIRSASDRLLQPTAFFAPPAPFDFIIDEKLLHVSQYENLPIHLQLKGDKLPENVTLLVNGERIVMSVLEDNRFEYVLKNVAAATYIQFEAAGYVSNRYPIHLLEVPTISDIRMELVYPRHVRKANETIASIQDVTVPYGTTITYHIAAQNASEILANNQSLSAVAGAFSFKTIVTADTQYAFSISNQTTDKRITFSSQIKMIDDVAPSIQISRTVDAIDPMQVLLTGIATDDYGIQKLTLIVDVKEKGQTKTFRKNLPIHAALSTTINAYLDLKVYSPSADQVSYFVEVCDNDAARGSKCVVSEIYTYKNPSVIAADSLIDQHQEALEQTVNALQSDQKQYQKQMQQLEAQIMQGSEMNTWEQKQAMEQLKSLQEKMKAQMEAMKKRLAQQQDQAKKLDLSESFQEKQEDAKKQIDDVVKNDLQKQLDKMNQLMEQLNQNKPPSVQQLQQMQQENKMSKMSMERLEAMIKKLEQQLQLEKTVQKAEALLQDQSDLLEKTKQEQTDAALLKKEQESLEKALEQFKKEELNKAAQESKSEDANEIQEAADEAQDAMDQSSDALEQKDKPSSQSKQQQAKQQLQKMKDKLGAMAGGMDMEQIDIDIKATRQILTNLLRLSFDQEQLLQTLKGKNINTDRIPEFVAQQSKLGRNAAMINDSLFSLSKRVTSIENAINRETNALTQNMRQAGGALAEQNLYHTLIGQQSAMTNANNLALMLNELLENLIQDQSQMQQEGAGSGSKSKGKPKPGQGTSAGEQLKDIISKQQQMGKGEQQGGQQSGQQPGQQGQGNSGEGQGGQNGQSGKGSQQGKDGQQGNEDGEYGNAEQLAKQAREQALIRQQMNQLNSILNSKAIKGNASDIKAIQDMMQQNEADLVYKRMNSAFYKRQQQIMQRMLQLEKAVREQEQDDKRQGNQAKPVERPIPPALKLEQQKFQQSVEQYKFIAPKLQPYYEQIGSEYLKRVQ